MNRKFKVDDLVVTKNDQRGVIVSVYAGTTKFPYLIMNNGIHVLDNDGNCWWRESDINYLHSTVSPSHYQKDSGAQTKDAIKIIVEGIGGIAAEFMLD